MACACSCKYVNTDAKETTHFVLQAELSNKFLRSDFPRKVVHLPAYYGIKFMSLYLSIRAVCTQFAHQVNLHGQRMLTDGNIRGKLVFHHALSHHYSPMLDPSWLSQNNKSETTNHEPNPHRTIQAINKSQNPSLSVILASTEQDTLTHAFLTLRTNQMSSLHLGMKSHTLKIV